MRSRARSLAVLAVLTASTFLAVGFAETTVFGQARSSGSTVEPTPKTPWGAPDLQGTWSNTTVVPFERSKEFGDREFMTDAEYKKALDQLREYNTRPALVLIRPLAPGADRAAWRPDAGEISGR